MQKDARDLVSLMAFVLDLVTALLTGLGDTDNARVLVVVKVETGFGCALDALEPILFVRPLLEDEAVFAAVGAETDDAHKVRVDALKLHGIGNVDEFAGHLEASLFGIRVVEKEFFAVDLGVDESAHAKVKLDLPACAPSGAKGQVLDFRNELSKNGFLHELGIEHAPHGEGDDAVYFVIDARGREFARGHIDGMAYGDTASAGSNVTTHETLT